MDGHHRTSAVASREGFLAACTPDVAEQANAGDGETEEDQPREDADYDVEVPFFVVVRGKGDESQAYHYEGKDP